MDAVVVVRLRFLWVSWLILMLFHTELGLMPLFHGLSVEIDKELSSEVLVAVFLAMCFYFIIPIIVLIILAWDEYGSMYKIPYWNSIHLFIGVIYSITNFLHLFAELEVAIDRKDQIILTSMIVGVGVLINWQSGILICIPELRNVLGNRSHYSPILDEGH
jgi:hypothetical protein